MVKRLAPVQAPPRATVHQKDGSPTWGHDGEIGARRDALVTLMEQSRFLWKPNLSFSNPRHGYLLRRLLNTKLKMRSEQLHSCQVGRLVRAFGVEVLQIKTSLEERLQSSGKQWLDSVRRHHCRHVHRPLLQHGQRLRPQAVFRKKIKMLRLHSYPNQAKTSVMRKIGEPSRCPATLARLGQKRWFVHLCQQFSKVACQCQLGSLSGRSTRDALSIEERTDAFSSFLTDAHVTTGR